MIAALDSGKYRTSCSTTTGVPARTLRAEGSHQGNGRAAHELQVRLLD